MNTIEKIVMGLNIAHARELNNAQERLKKRQAILIDLANAVESDATALFESRQASVKAIAELEDYVSKLENCPQVIVTGSKRARGFTAEIKKEWDEAYSAFQSQANSEGVNNGNKAGMGAAMGGAAMGGAFATLGPSAAMAIATTFGTASTGAAISGLSGIAATNAALAWLGGGAVAAGGAGIAGGTTLLALFGPIGWALAGVGLAGGIFLSRSKNKKELDRVVKLTNEVNQYISQLQEKQEKIVSLRIETETRTQAIDIHTPILQDCLDFSSEQFPKEALFGIVGNAKLLGKMTRERV